MQAEELCHKWLSGVMPGVHAKRLLALSATVEGAYRGGTLSVTGLGRAIRSEAKMKHSIKRADRLCSNKHLQSEREEIYKQMSMQLLRNNHKPILLVDWSDIDARRQFFLLRASLAVKGRSLTLYEEVHPKETKERRSTHNAFLRTLKELLPPTCTPVIVTDAGFRTPWFQQVKSLGWDFIGRVRNREMVHICPEREWIGAKTLYERATSKSRIFQDSQLTRSNPLECTLVLYKGKLKGRKRITKMGKTARNHSSLVCAARAREPWLLTTSLSSVSSEKIVSLYSKRMQIEESFRDLKCPRFGLGLYHNRTYKLERMRILVMLGSLATNFAWMLGSIARSQNLHKQFQANTTFSMNVLSNVFIGIQILRNSHLRIPWTFFKQHKLDFERQLYYST